MDIFRSFCFVFYILVVSKFVSSKYSKLLDIASSFFLLFIAILGFAYNIKELVKI